MYPFIQCNIIMNISSGEFFHSRLLAREVTWPQEKSNNLIEAGIQWFFPFKSVITTERTSQSITSCVVRGDRSGGVLDRLD